METAKVSLFVCLAVATGLGTWYLGVRAPDNQWRLADQAGQRLIDQERFGEAERQFTMAIEAARTFGDQDSRRALSLVHLANVVCVQGRQTDAISLCQQALAINEKTLGSAHPDVASCLVSLATPYGKLAKNVEAEKLLQRAISIDENALGREHLDVASPVNSLAWVRWNQGRYVDAERLARRSLAIREKALGSSHVDVGRSLYGLGSFLIRQDRFSEARAALERARAILEHTLGSEHLEMSGCLIGLANCDRKARADFIEAKRRIEHALAIREKRPESRPRRCGRNAWVTWPLSTATTRARTTLPKALTRGHCRSSSIPWGRIIRAWHWSLTRLALIDADRGNHAQAEARLTRALTIREKVLGMSHPQVAFSLSRLAGFNLERGRDKES